MAERVEILTRALLSQSESRGEAQALEELGSMKSRMHSIALKLAHEVQLRRQLEADLEYARKQIQAEVVSREEAEQRLEELQKKAKFYQSEARSYATKAKELQLTSKKAEDESRAASKQVARLQTAARVRKNRKKCAELALVEKETLLQQLASEATEYRNQLEERETKIGQVERELAELQVSQSQAMEDLAQSTVYRRQATKLDEMYSELQCRYEMRAEELKTVEARLCTALKEKREYADAAHASAEEIESLKALSEELRNEMELKEQELERERVERAVGQRALLEQLGVMKSQLDREKLLRSKSFKRVERLATLLTADEDNNVTS